MITLLPIKLITENEQPIFGANIFNLSKLANLDFPVASGIALAPPEIFLQTVLRHLQDQKAEVFEQRLTIIKGETARIPVPEELNREFKKWKSCFYRGTLYNKPQNLWQAILGLWLEQIRSKIWREGFSQGMTSHLHAQAVFPVSGRYGEAKGHFDPETKEVIINSSAKITPLARKKIEELVLQVNKKLFLPQVVYFLITKKSLQIIGLSPFTQTLPVSEETDIVIPQTEQTKLIKSAVKVFLNLSSGFATSASSDGVLIEGEKIGDLAYREAWFESTVFKLAEAALSFHQKTVIFKLPNLTDKEEIQGVLRLINQQSVLDEATRAFLFARNKKNLLNIELALPLTRSTEELLQIKRELAVREINRKGTLRLWLEMAVPENLINIEDYLSSGLDGVILNLDSLQNFLGGYDVVEGEFYKKQVRALLKFIQLAFKILHKQKIPVLVKGELVLHHDVLDFLIDQGVWGVVANSPLEADNLPEHLNWAEKRMVEKRLS